MYTQALKRLPLIPMQPLPTAQEAGAVAILQWPQLTPWLNVHACWQLYGIANIIYTVTSGVGCSSAFTSSPVTVNALPAVSAGNTSVCAGSNITLPGSPSGGTWSVANPYSNSVPGSYDYTYTFTNGSGCTTSAMSSVTVNPLPSVTAGNISVCAGSNVTLPGSTSWAAHGL